VGWDISYSLAETPSEFYDFTVMSTQDPLSVGGTWTNNTQGTGGNVAMNAQSSMRVIAAASGGINIAAGDATGQSSPPASADYMDSFAFKPGFSGNLRVTATIYVNAGYSPPTDTDNHELELLLGCSSSAGARTWMSCTWNRDGARIMALMNGAPNGFTIFTPEDFGSATPLVDGDVWSAEINRTTNRVTTYLNGAMNLRSQTGEASLVAVASGNGLGIGSFRRTAAGQSAANRYGFRNVRYEVF
jgi:hypothetical protein